MAQCAIVSLRLSLLPASLRLFLSLSLLLLLFFFPPPFSEPQMMRIYTKPKGQIPDYEEPVVLHDSNPSVEQFCNRLHKGIMAQFKHAWVWGSSVKHQPQRVGKDHRLNDEDVIQIVKKI